MTAENRALLLVGSPRGKKSSSMALGTYLLDRLQERGWEADKIHIHPALRSSEKREKMLAAVNGANLVALVFPLYVDSIPAAAIHAMELIAARRQAAEVSPKFIAIVNCGFPEAYHNDTALAICRQFAREANFEWAGGLLLGAGQGAVQGQSLAEAGGRVRNITKSLDLTAAALAAGDAVPQEAIDLMAKPFIPPWLYRAMGSVGWYFMAREYGTMWKLRARPYAKEL